MQGAIPRTRVNNGMFHQTTRNYLLGIETSCDDTSIALLSWSASHSAASSDAELCIEFHESFSQELLLRKFGGVVPELAARHHVEKIFPLIDAALSKKNLSLKNLNYIAVTCGPGLLGPLLTGLNTAKMIATLFPTSIIPVNHLQAHLEAIHLTEKITYPYLGVAISGGHSFFALMHEKNKWQLIGSTLDDALGEALDKGGKLLGLPYPAGKLIDRLAKFGNLNKKLFPTGLKNRKQDCALSYSGLKNALRLHLQAHPEILQSKPTQWDTPENSAQIYYDTIHSYLYAALQTLIHKIPMAQKMAQQMIQEIAPQTHKSSLSSPKIPLVFGGGVACNSLLKEMMSDYGKLHNTAIYFVAPHLCTDNALMIAHWAYRHLDHAVMAPDCFKLEPFSRTVDREKQELL